MRCPPERFQVADEKLAAPDRAVSTKSCTVECHPDDRLGKAMLRHATGHMGMVMLDRNGR